MTNALDNPVGFLQEFCQKNKADTFPFYSEVGSSGPDHCRKFTCKCLYGGLETMGTANQKKQAKFEAAKLMIDLLIQKNYFDQFNYKPGSDTSSETNYSEDYKIPVSKNPISGLQEYCQSSKIDMPVYFETSTMGGGFVCECVLPNHKTYGHGTTKKTAKTEAANKMCIELNLVSLKEEYCQSEGIVKETVKSKVEQPNENDDISALQKLCDQKSNLTSPVYEFKEFKNNAFVMTCNVGSISAEGSYSTKQGAKHHAARKVFGVLMANEFAKQGTSEQPRTSSSLQEYNLDSDEEDKGEILKNDISLDKQMESLNLEGPREVDFNAETPVKVKVEADHLIANPETHQDVDSELSKDNEIPHTKTEKRDGRVE